jgi:O-antigen/teichoic acid export membrane protein
LDSPVESVFPPQATDPRLWTRLYGGIARNFVSAGFNQGSTFALNIVAAHALGRLRFGEFMIVQTTLTTLGNLGQLATGYTATKYVAEFRTREPARAASILRLCASASTLTGFAVMLGLLIGAPYLAGHAFEAPALAPALMIAAPTALFIVVSGFRTGALGGLEAYSALARVGVIGGTSYFTLGAIGAFLGGLNGALLGVGASWAVQWIMLGRLLHREQVSQGLVAIADDPWAERNVLLRFALPASISGFVSMPAWWLASTILVRQPAGFEQLALFGAANMFRVIVLFLPNTINAVAMSLLNNQRGTSNAAFRRIFWWNLAVTAGCAIVAAGLAAATGNWLLHAFGRSFDEGYPTLLILMLTAVIEAVAVAFYQVVQSQAKIWLSLFVIAIPRDGLIVIAAYLLTPTLGAAGLASAYAIGWTVALCTTVALAFRLGIHAGIGEGSAPLGAGAIDAGCL